MSESIRLDRANLKRLVAVLRVGGAADVIEATGSSETMLGWRTALDCIDAIADEMPDLEREAEAQ